jgi:hypothetical protein
MARTGTKRNSVRLCADRQKLHDKFKEGWMQQPARVTVSGRLWNGETATVNLERSRRGWTQQGAGAARHLCREYTCSLDEIVREWIPIDFRGGVDINITECDTSSTTTTPTTPQRWADVADDMDDA